MTCSSICYEILKVYATKENRTLGKVVTKGIVCSIWGVKWERFPVLHSRNKNICLEL